MHELKDLNTLILTHYFAYGPAYDLEHYLRKLVRRLTIIEFPLYLKIDSVIKLRSYDNDNGVYIQKRLHISALPRYTVLEVITRLAHYLTILLSKLTNNSRYDVAISEDPITAFLAIILRKMKKIRYVIFQSHAYVTSEYNHTYKLIDYYATQKSDVVWALSSKLAKVRKALGAKHVIHTPICLRDDIVEHIKRLQEAKENAVVYVGALNKAKGADILLKIMPTLVRLFDKIYVIGEGPYSKVFNRLSNMPESKIEYMGRLPLRQSMQIARRSLLGLVLTRPSYEVLTTDPMKPKIYIASHTPIIVPRYFEITRSVKEFSAGLVVNCPSKDRVAELLVRFISNPDKYVEGAKNMAKYFDYWRCSTILKCIIEKTLYSLGIR